MEILIWIVILALMILRYSKIENYFENKKYEKLQGTNELKHILSLKESQERMKELVPEANHETDIHHESDDKKINDFLRCKEKYFGSRKWKKLRTKIRKRDGSMCVLCQLEDRLQVHHKTYVRFENEDEDDLVTLCNKCHYHLHQELGKPNYAHNLDGQWFWSENREDLRMRNYKQRQLI